MFLWCLMLLLVELLIVVPFLFPLLIFIPPIFPMFVLLFYLLFWSVDQSLAGVPQQSIPRWQNVEFEPCWAPIPLRPDARVQGVKFTTVSHFRDFDQFVARLSPLNALLGRTPVSRGSNLRQSRILAILAHLMFQISFGYLSGSLRQPLGASGSLREAFSKVLVFVPGSSIPLRRNDRFEPFLCFCGGGLFREVKFTTVSHFNDFD